MMAAAVAVSPVARSPETRSRRKPKQETEALNILLEIPGISSKTQLKSWLFIARRVLPGDDDNDEIRSYIRNSQEHGFGIKVLDIVRIVRKGSIEFDHDDEKKRKFRMMLWHGTKDAHVANILQNGIQNPPMKNQMFGPGIYFADRASKSAQYCTNTPQPSRPADGDVGYLFLCDVLLGSMYNARQAKNGTTSPPAYTKKSGEQVACDSVRCTGGSIPDRTKQKKIGNCIWPNGPTVKNTKYSNYSVRYNEYTVYDPDKVRTKYLVKVQFETNPYMY